MELPSVAIIIPVKRFNENLRQSIERCLRLDYPAFEIIVLPDEAFGEFKGNIKMIATGPMGPAEKRDLALAHSQAEVFAFLDDDAYPEPQWLRNAMRHFRDDVVAAVGGPAVTPPESPLRALASGHVYASALASGRYTYRYVPGSRVMEVDDYPSCNFLVRRTVFAELGGFDSTFYPGEDTKLCRDITRRLGKKIMYDPEVLVYHHRRLLGVAHMRQVANYGRHRGYFVRCGQETSRKPAYFVPSLFVLALTGGAVSALVWPGFRPVYAAGMLAYALTVLCGAVAQLRGERHISAGRKIALTVLIAGGIFLTHVTYGLFFIRGLLGIGFRKQKTGAT